VRLTASPLVLLLGIVGLTACAAEANYTVQLRPVVPLNQEPFRDGPHVWIGIQDEDTETDWIDLDTLSSGSAQETGFGPLDGDRIGVALAGAAAPSDDPAGLFAYGASPPLRLSDGGDELDLGVLIAETGGAGALSSLEEPAYGAALAVLDDGRVYAFGGIRIAGGQCEASIRRMTSLNDGQWVLEEIGAELPEGVCYARATVVQVDGTEQIVITGGETAYNGYNQRSAKATLFDPQTETIVGTTDGVYTRARHTVAPLPDGRLLLVGAHQIGSVPPSSGTWEVLDPAGPTYGAYGTTEIAPWEFMSAPLPGGVALCGGGQWVRTTITPLSSCVVLTGDGSTSSLPSLPWRLRAGAMARLGDGRLVVAGGITEEGNAGSNLSGVKAAFILDPDADEVRWEQLPDMNEARAYPEAVPDHRGGVVIVGGAEKAWGFGGSPAGVASCGERLILDDGEPYWEPLTTCGEGATGTLPSVGINEGFGAVLLEGRTDSGDGASAVAIVPRGPTR